MLTPEFADFVDRYDMWMIQVGDSLGFTVEALHVGRGGELPRQDHLQGDHTIQTDLAGLEHHSHAAPGDLVQQLIVADVADRARGSYSFPSFQPKGFPAGGSLVALGQRPGQGDDLLLRREKRLQLRRQIGIALEPLLGLGMFARFHGLEISGDGFIQTPLAF